MELKVYKRSHLFNFKKTITQKEFNTIIGLLKTGHRLKMPDGKVISRSNYVANIKHYAEDIINMIIQGAEYANQDLAQNAHNYLESELIETLTDYDVEIIE